MRKRFISVANLITKYNLRKIRHLMQPDLSSPLALIRLSSSFAEFHDSSCLRIENSRDHSILLAHSLLLMAISVTLLGESLIAVFALERSDATMHADVVHHVAKLGERVSTSDAH